jgi:hypothetical protein
MPKDQDRVEAQKVVQELRNDAARLVKRSLQLADEAERLKQRADDLDQLIKQRDARVKKK